MPVHIQPANCLYCQLSVNGAGGVLKLLKRQISKERLRVAMEYQFLKAGIGVGAVGWLVRLVGCIAPSLREGALNTTNQPGVKQLTEGTIADSGFETNPPMWDGI